MNTKNMMKSWIFMFLLTGLYSSSAHAQWTFSLSGTEDRSHTDLVESRDSRWTFSASVYLLQYMSIGISHSQVNKITVGEKERTGAQLNEHFEDRLKVVSNSFNLTVVLFSGPITPYIFGGIARKWYYYVYNYEFSTAGQDFEYTPDDNGQKNLWNAGLGFSIPVSYNFSVKIKRNWTPVELTDPITKDKKKVYDTYTEVGLTYKI